MTDEMPLSDMEQRVLAKLFEGMNPRDIGQVVQLSDPNVRVAIARLKIRYQVSTLAEVMDHARREFGAE